MSGEPGRAERLPGNRAAVIRNLDCLVLHGLPDPLQKLLFTSDDGDWPVSETIQRLNALFLLQHAPKPTRPRRMSRQAEPLRNPVQDKVRIVIRQDDPSDIAFIGYLSGEGDQVTHAAAPSGHGYSAAEDPRILSQRFHESLGAVPPPHRVLLASASGPMLEEMLFRGLLFWLIFELLRRCRVSKLAAVSATILVIAVGFAFSHAGRTGLSLYTTILTGIAFGWMRAQSESTAAAALMHAVYNLVLSYLATF